MHVDLDYVSIHTLGMKLIERVTRWRERRSERQTWKTLSNPRAHEHVLMKILVAKYLYVFQMLVWTNFTSMSKEGLSMGELPAF